MKYKQKSGRLCSFLRIVFSVLVTLYAFPVTAHAQAECEYTACQGPTAGEYCAAPNGSGRACTPVSPCRIEEALSQAGSGETIILADGLYREKLLFTQRDGVTIRAENPLGAKISTTRGDQSPHRRAFNIVHSNITLRGIEFNGEGGIGGITVGHASRQKNRILDVTIEGVYIHNSGGAGISLASHGKNPPVSNVVIRNNRIFNIGLSGVGEAIYAGAAPNKSPPEPGLVSNVKIYGNTFSRYTQNGVDLKRNTMNFEIYNNIFENQHFIPNVSPKTANEGAITANRASRIAGNHKIYNNVFRNLRPPGSAVFIVGGNGGGTEIYNNVVYNSDGRPAQGIKTDASGDPGRIYDNIFCNIERPTVTTTNGLQFTNNAMNAPGSECIAREQAIATETATLPSCGPVDFPPVPISGPFCDDPICIVPTSLCQIVPPKRTQISG